MLAYALVAGGPAALGPFTAVWLHSRGFGFDVLGVLLAVPLLLRVALCRPLAAWGARFTSPWTPIALLCGLAGSLSLVSALTVVPALTLIAWWGICIAANVCTPLIDAATLASTPVEQSSRALGAAKGAGAMAYLLAVPALGYCLSHTGAVSMLLWSAIAAMVACLHAASLSALRRAPAGKRNDVMPPLRAPSTNRRKLALMLIAATLIEASHGLQGIAMIHWQARGISLGINGILWGTGTLADILFLWTTGVWRKRIDPSALLAIGGAAAVTRWIGFAMDPPLPILFLLQILHALSFTATCLALVELTHMMTDRAGSRRQLVTWGTSTGLAGGVGILAAVPLYGAMGTNGYWIMAALAAGGFAVAAHLHRAGTPQLSRDTAPLNIAHSVLSHTTFT